MPEALAGLTVVVTRPAHVARATCEALQAAGAQVIAAPVLAIEALPCALPSTQGVQAAIFVSANAVEFGLPLLRRAGFACDARCFAVGEATASALRESGQTDVLAPGPEYDSEHLLALPGLREVRGQHLLLIKGRGSAQGRDLIEHTLAGRGARIEVLTCYRRRRLPIEPALRASLAARLDEHADAVVFLVASVESFEALRDTFADDALLRRAAIAVPHARVAAALREAGFARAGVVPLSPARLSAALREVCWTTQN
jgi:uroporphyrinogen-III synthase